MTGLAHTEVSAPMNSRFKGAAFREFITFFASSRGRDELRERFDTIPEHLLQGLDREDGALGILASKWYPAAQVHAILDAISGHLGHDEFKRLADEGAAAAMNGTLKGVYGLLFSWMATPERYAQHANRLWSQYTDSGDFEVSNDGERCAIATLSNWDMHHPLICLMNRAAADHIYAAMGCANVRTVRECCVDQGTPECRYVTTWHE